MIRLILAEDQTMLLDAFEALLHLEDDIQIVGRATDGREALKLIREHRPDVVLTDIEMPHVTGIELAEKILQENLPSRVMIVTTFGRSGYLRRALQAGVRGYMLKDAPITQLAAAIRKVAAGGGRSHPIWPKPSGTLCPIRFPNANAPCFVWPKPDARTVKLRKNCPCRQEQSAIISRKSYRSWTPGTA